MAYQPKSYRKFVATAATATLVASAVAPAYAGSFSDVSDKYSEAVNFVVSKGVDGFADGTFGVSKNITRVDAAVMLVKVLGLDIESAPASGFSDVPARAEKYVNALKEAGITAGKGGKFDSYSNITRGELAIWIQKGFELEAAADAESFSDVSKVYEEAVKALVSNEVTFGKGGKFGVALNATRGEFALFLHRADKAIQSPVEKVTVESVSAINSTAYTLNVAFAEGVTAADLAGKSLTLTNGSVSVSASFTSLDGTTALFTINSTDRSKLVNGNYAVSSSNLTVPAGAITTFSGIVSNTNVEGIVVDENGDAVSNATVMAAGHEVKTDSNGYYKLPVNAGLVDVKFTKDERYFVKREQSNVTRNFSTVQNASLLKIDVTKLEVLGTAVDTKTGAAVVDADVVLQKKVDGKWVTVGSTTTDVNGEYTFGNSAAVNPGNLLSTDAIDLTSDFQVVYSKDLTSTNLDNVYESKTVAVTLSDESHTTNMLTELRPVKELKELKVDVSWADLTGTDNDADFTTTDLTFELLDKDGKTVLVDDADLTSTFAAKSSGEKEIANPLDLVAGGFFQNGGSTVPTVPTGTYFLKVNDGTNAIAVLPIKVSEGVNYAGEVTIQKARTLNVTGNYAEVLYAESLANRLDGQLTTIDNAAAPTLSPVEANILLTQRIEGVDVVIGEVAGETFEYDSTDSSITSNEAITQLATGTYALTFESDYVLNGKATKSTTISTDVKNETLSFNTASAVDLTLTDDAGAVIADKDVSVELLNATGTTVVKSYDLKTDASGVVALPGVKPGEYKLRVSASGYKSETGDKFKVLDIQDRTETLSLEEIPAPELSGYVKFANDFTNVLDATVMVYNQDGEEVAYYDVTAGVYDFSNEELEAGKSYTFVVRGTGLETAVATRTIVDGENDPLNFKVVRGAQGMAKFSITDSTFKPLNAGDLTITDSYYSADAIATFAGVDDSTDGPNHIGEFDATVSLTDSKAWATATELSAGDYELLIESADTVDYESVFTIKDINSTYYEAIKVQTTTSAITHKISGTLTGTGLAASAVDYVVAFDSNGKIVAMDSANNFTNGDTFSMNVSANKTYTVAVFANGHYVASKVVTVQDFDVTADFSVDVATR